MHSRTSINLTRSSTLLRSKRVAFIIDHMRLGGAQSVAYELARRLLEENIQTYLINLRGETELSSELRKAGVSVKSLSLPRLSPGFSKALRSAIDEIKPAIVHTHLDFSNTFGSRAAALSGVPIIIRHDHSGRTIKNWGYYIKRSLAEKLIIGETHVIAVSKDVKTFNVGLGVNPKNIFVINNAIDTTRFSLDRGEQANLGLGFKKPPTVGFIGRLNWYKGLVYLIEAAPHILRNVPEARFVIVGEGPQRWSLENRLSRMGLNRAFFFKGQQRRPEEFYRGFDVVVVPSILESFGLSVIEAMAMARPVVASRVGGITDIIDDGKNGVLVKPRDSQTLAEKVSRLLLDPKLARQMGAEARKHIERNFSIEKSIVKVIGLYDRLLRRSTN